MAERDWEAYPRFAPPEKFAPFRLADGLFYSNAWENAASAMEMSAIAGKNSALLVRHFLQDPGTGLPSKIIKNEAEPVTSDL